MFIGTISDTKLASKLHPLLNTFFEFVNTHDFDTLPLGRIEIQGDDIFVNNVEVQGVRAENQPLEMHRKYIDVHVLLRGNETIGWKPIERIAALSQEYNEDGDCALSQDTPDTYVTLTPGDFCIVFPEDPHAPAISEGPIRKLIGKIKL